MTSSAVILDGAGKLKVTYQLPSGKPGSSKCQITIVAFSKGFNRNQNAYAVSSGHCVIPSAINSDSTENSKASNEERGFYGAENALSYSVHLQSISATFLGEQSFPKYTTESLSLIYASFGFTDISIFRLPHTYNYIYQNHGIIPYLIGNHSPAKGFTYQVLNRDSFQSLQGNYLRPSSAIESYALSSQYPGKTMRWNQAHYFYLPNPTNRLFGFSGSGYLKHDTKTYIAILSGVSQGKVTEPISVVLNDLNSCIDSSGYFNIFTKGCPYLLPAGTNESTYRIVASYQGSQINDIFLFYPEEQSPSLSNNNSSQISTQSIITPEQPTYPQHTYVQNETREQMCHRLYKNDPNNFHTNYQNCIGNTYIEAQPTYPQNTYVQNETREQMCHRLYKNDLNNFHTNYQNCIGHTSQTISPSYSQVETQEQTCHRLYSKNYNEYHHCIINIIK